MSEEASRNVTWEIYKERRRQVDTKWWTDEHDDAHVKGELATAGGVYAMYAGMSDGNRASYEERPPIQWPFGNEFWKPADRRRELIKAAALITAEIERLDRMG